MPGFYEMVHNGKKVYCLDIAEMQIKDEQLIHQHIETAKQNIKKQPLKSVLHLTNVTNTRFDTKMANIIKEYAEHNSPYIKASVVVGVTGLQKIVLQTIKTVTGRNFYIADTVDEGLKWLMSQ
jgi:hypothetical protein